MHVYLIKIRIIKINVNITNKEISNEEKEERINRAKRIEMRVMELNRLELLLFNHITYN